MSLRINSARTPKRNPNASQVIFRPKTGHTPRKFSFTFDVIKPQKEELSQEKYVEKLTDDLDKQILIETNSKALFKLHQDTFQKIVDRFELKNKAFTKVKGGYEEIINKLQNLQKENKVYQMSMKSISDSVQTEVIALQNKIQTKRSELHTLLANLDSLIEDIRAENKEHTKNINALKDKNTSIDFRRLDAEANFAELSAQNRKKQLKYEGFKQEQSEQIQQEHNVEQQIVDSKNLTVVLINELVDDNELYESLKKDVARLEEEKKQLISDNETLKSQIEEKHTQEGLVQTQLDTLVKEIECIREKEEKYVFDLSKIARQMHVPNKLIQNAGSSYVSLLEECLKKYRI